ncbi:MAG: IS1634 family transposase [Candidatus Levybacteria bacterium]|nr:IS1634 family transposase [Candidatus Levybacteria bacterium]
MRTRIVPTASGKKAIQVVSKQNGKVTVHKHIGTYSTPEQKAQLLKEAEKFILHTTGQTNFLDLISSVRPLEIAITQSRPKFLYDLLSAIYDKLGLGSFPDTLIKDLVIARLYQPASKLETSEILKDSFGRDYALKTIYRHLKKGMEQGVKESFQQSLIDFAKEGLGDSLRLIFYDVTTLYFESHLKSQLKEFGFSKDHRSQDTQVVVGLVVNNQGFPLYFDVFSGKTFEGHTFIPVIKNIQKLLGGAEIIVVADAAMVSKDNIEKLEAEKIGFVVGARLANLPQNLIDSITSKLNGTDGQTRTETYRNQRLICQYSAVRAAKDKSDRLKQVTKAQTAISTPSQITKRFRFLKQEGSQLSLNTDLVTKAEKLEGIKGYLTNTNLPETAVIEKYHDLWKIENSFRITKSDLEARPVFHRLDETIKAHLVIVFAGLAIARYIEIKTYLSIRRVLKIAGKVLTHKVTNTKTGEMAYVETTIEDSVLKEEIGLLKTLGH